MRSKQRSKRSGIYIQERVGPEGPDGELTKIEIRKLTTMVPGAEELTEEVSQEHGIVMQRKVKADPRVIPSKAWMRWTHADELLQLWNVLIKRDMKLVGIRVLAKDDFDRLPPDIPGFYRHNKPALADVAQSEGKLPETPEEAYAIYRQYIREYNEHPFRTGVKYLFKILHSKVIRGNWGI